MTDKFALLADIGGTNARFALGATGASAPLLVDTIRQFEVADFPSLADAARHYLDGVSPVAGHVHAGVFAVAGRIDGDEARITNHPWVISRAATRQALGLDSVRLVNDFAAQALAVEFLAAGDLVSIGGHAPLHAAQGERTFAVIGPGTGLGVSALLVRDGRRIALETEGGHISFAAGTEEEAAILQVLARQFGDVSNERLVSGRGLVNIHRALGVLQGEDTPAMRPQDISAGAMNGDERCLRAVEIFCSIFGAIAGDLVLTLGAWDGVFLSGGLVPKLLDSLQRSQFRQRFKAKGRFSSALEKVPTIAVTHPHAGLLGAAAMAVHGDVR